MGDTNRFFQIFSKNIRAILTQMRGETECVQEVRMRINAPLFVIYKNQEFSIDRQGQFIAGQGKKLGERNRSDGEDGVPYIVTKEDVEETLMCAAGYSLYAFEDELRHGFITVFGGHRIGVTGRVVLNRDTVKTIQPATSLNIRFAHQVKGCADSLIPYLFERKTDRFFHTLLIAPPCCGKTTLLRDLVRQISDGGPFHAGRNVAVVDERSEIGACYQGVPQNDVGMRTDILDACPKAEGMMMMIRSMSPSVVAVDEIGGERDLDAIQYVMNCGCKILATVHGTAMEDIRQKPMLRELLKNHIFERYVILSAEKGPGTVADICDEEGRSLICG